MTNSLVREIRDADEARRYLLQSCWLARVQPPSAQTLVAALRWALEIVAEGQPLPPLGFVSDLGWMVQAGSRELMHSGPELNDEWDHTRLRRYEDYVLGRLLTDRSFERAGDAMRRYRDRDHDRCLAFLATQLRTRAGLGGVHLSPGVVKSLASTSGEGLMAAMWEPASRQPSAALIDDVEQLIRQIRNAGELLGREDVFELEHGTALHEFSQRVALRQVLQASEFLGAGLSHHRPRSGAQRRQVASHLASEDTYPVGGFASLSNRGSMESLLFSQLAYIEPESRPDLFDIKFLRDELLYYSRDDNQFFRHRRTFVFALFPELVQARVKDAESPWQRMVLLLGLLYAAVHQLIAWLSDEALAFDLVLIRPDGTKPALVEERGLLETLFREQVDNGTVVIRELTLPQCEEACRQHARRRRTVCVTISNQDQRLDAESFELERLRICSAVPDHGGRDEPLRGCAESGIAGWQRLLAELLAGWAC